MQSPPLVSVLAQRVNNKLGAVLIPPRLRRKGAFRLSVEPLVIRAEVFILTNSLLGQAKKKIL